MEKLLEIKKMICGCGNPDLVWDTIRDYLKEREDWANDRIEWKPLETGKDYLLAYLMDHFGLTEHGGSVGGAWLTIEGERTLRYLEELFELLGEGQISDVDNEIEEELLKEINK
jgi:hypothetical protein